jgi:lysozyme
MLPAVSLRVAATCGLAAALSVASAQPAAAAAARAASVLRGTDISAYQHAGAAINWAALVRAGLRFVAIKATEGTYYVNHYYKSDARAAAKAGLAVLPYTFANPKRSAGPATAAFAVGVTKGTRTSLPLVMDLENDPYAKNNDCYGFSVPAMNGWIAGFIAEFQRRTHQNPVIYTTAAWWQECTGDTSRFHRAPLWLAAYNGTPATPPPAWGAWTFLQYNDNATIAGLTQADLDYYHPTPFLPALTKHSTARRTPTRPRPAKKTPPKPKAKTVTKQGPGPPAKPKANPHRPKPSTRYVPRPKRL